METKLRVIPVEWQKCLSLTVDAKQKGHEISVFNYISKSMPFITEILLKLGRVNTDIGNITKIAINLVISKS